MNGNSWASRPQQISSRWCIWVLKIDHVSISYLVLLAVRNRVWNLMGDILDQWLTLADSECRFFMRCSVSVCCVSFVSYHWIQSACPREPEHFFFFDWRPNGWAWVTRKTGQEFLSIHILLQHIIQISLRVSSGDRPPILSWANFSVSI